MLKTWIFFHNTNMVTPFCLLVIIINLPLNWFRISPSIWNTLAHMWSLTKRQNLPHKIISDGFVKNVLFWRSVSNTLSKWIFQSEKVPCGMVSLRRSHFCYYFCPQAYRWRDISKKTDLRELLIFAIFLECNKWSVAIPFEKNGPRQSSQNF